ncbi:MAG TPA: phosphohistidine phosphatase SixA, partial [Elusimicrobiota bacterium]|nr:phosphohistidine phosphatase SixA [Elusimicrobiota bacterium]
MELYILRHGPAMERTRWKKADSDRPLTDDGRRKMKKIARGMRSLGLDFDAILTSPFRRAHDSARIVAEALEALRVLKISRSLAPDGDQKALIRHLALDFRSWEKVLLVGHEPSLSRLISLLTTGAEEL